MSDKNNNNNNTSSKSSDAPEQPSQAGPSGSHSQNTQPQGNVQPTTNGTNNTQKAGGRFENLPIRPDGPPWNPLDPNRALNSSDTPTDPADLSYLDTSDDRGGSNNGGSSSN